MIVNVTIIAVFLDHFYLPLHANGRLALANDRSSLYCWPTIDHVTIWVSLRRCRIPEWYWLLPFNAHCCHIGTAIKHPLPDLVKP